MPGGDRTGPLGEGSLTGRGFGPCGRGQARGTRFGFRRAYPVYREPVELSKEEKVKILEAEKADVEAELKEIEKEISEIKKK